MKVAVSLLKEDIFLSILEIYEKVVRREVHDFHLKKNSFILLLILIFCFYRSIFKSEILLLTKEKPLPVKVAAFV